MAIRDISEGSRIEITGIRTLDDAAKALDMIQSHPSFPDRDATFHAYITAGRKFTFWTEGTYDEQGS